MPSLEYPLPALTLTEKDCKYIMAPVIEAGLHSVAICKKFPRAVAYGPIEEGGIEINNIYITQGSSRLSLLYEHLGADTIMGKMIRICIEMCKTELGVGRNMFQLDYEKYHHILTDCWIKDNWKFANEKNIIIHDYKTPNLQLH